MSEGSSREKSNAALQTWIDCHDKTIACVVLCELAMRVDRLLKEQPTMPTVQDVMREATELGKEISDGKWPEI
jgi:hypothetical protein